MPPVVKWVLDFEGGYSSHFGYKVSLRTKGSEQPFGTLRIIGLRTGEAVTKVWAVVVGMADCGRSGWFSRGDSLFKKYLGVLEALNQAFAPDL